MNNVDEYYDNADDYYEEDEENDAYYEDEVNEVVASLSVIEINPDSNIDGMRKPSYKDVLLIPEKRVFLPPPSPQLEIKPWRPELAIVKMKDIIGDVPKDEPTSFQNTDDYDDDGLWGLIDNVARCKFNVSKCQQNRSNTSLLTQKQQEVKLKRISLKD